MCCGLYGVWMARSYSLFSRHGSTIDRRCPTLISMQMLVSCVDLHSLSVDFVAFSCSCNYSKDLLCLNFYCSSLLLSECLFRPTLKHLLSRFVNKTNISL